MNKTWLRISVAAVFGLIYAFGAAFSYGRGGGIFAFHFAFAAMSAWSFFAVSGILEGRRDRPTLAHPLIKWPAFILLVCVVVSTALWRAGWQEWFRPVAPPALAAVAALAGGLGGYLSLRIRR